MIVVYGRPVSSNSYKGKEKTYYSHDVLVERSMFGDRPALLRIGVPEDSEYLKGGSLAYHVYLGKESRCPLFSIYSRTLAHLFSILIAALSTGLFLLIMPLAVSASSCRQSP